MTEASFDDVDLVIKTMAKTIVDAGDGDFGTERCPR
jgi:hypothetical protein